MKPKQPPVQPVDDLFRSRLDNIINQRHELVTLADSIDWTYLDSKVGVFYSAEGRPAIPSRLMIGLHLLKQMNNVSDDVICEQWVENPYYQYFCGEEYFRHEFPIERSSMTHFRNRVGEEFFVTLMQESLNTAHKLGALEPKHLERVIVDTTVQPKAITHPTDAKLRYTAIVKLNSMAKQNGILLRQSYLRVAKQKVVASSRYRHAKQMKRARKAEKKLNTWLGRIIRDIERKIVNNEELQEHFAESLAKAQRIHTQQRTDSGKLYSWHAPEVECISKGKAHKPYEFGCKVTITTNLHPAKAGHFVLHAAALHGNPYDGHTLKQVIEEYKTQMGREPKRIYVDKGYQGHHCTTAQLKVYQSGQKRGVTKNIKKEIKRRSAVEPLIGHMKNEGRLGRNYLYGVHGDRINTLLVSAGYNFKLILRWLRILLFFFWSCLFERLGVVSQQKKALLF